MPFQSKLPAVEIPECNLLSFLFPGGTADDAPLWTNADDDTKRITTGDALSIIKRLSLGLERRGVPTGSSLMVVSPNQIYVPVLYLTVAGSGRIFTAANPSYTVKELVHQMKMMQPAILLLHPQAMDAGLEAASNAGVSKDRIFSFAETYQKPTGGIRDWSELLASEKDGNSWTWNQMSGKESRETTAIVNFSSGTTGLPKGVAITHHNIIANACQVIAGRYHKIEQPQPGQDRWLAFLPWFHAYAQLFSIVITSKLRQPVYAMAQFRFEDYVRHIEKYKITTLLLVPPVLVMLNKRPEVKQHDLTSVNYVMSAAAPLKKDLQNSIAKKLGAIIAQSWGMTETTCTGLIVPGQMEDDSGSVGVLLPNTEAMLVDPEGKETKGPGELWIRGPQMMKEYIYNEKATKDTLHSEGWLLTGDIAEEKDGKWWIVDRQKELIKVKGFQVAPAELEAVLLELDQVVDAAVVGIEIEGEEVPRAYVALSEKAKEAPQKSCEAIQKSVAEQVVKHKRLVGGVVPVDAVPRLQSGKIKRAVVKAWGQEDEKRLQKQSSAKL